jgi:hypothetical protein
VFHQWLNYAACVSFAYVASVVNPVSVTLGKLGVLPYQSDKSSAGIGSFTIVLDMPAKPDFT